METPFFTEKDFLELAAIKGEKVAVRFPSTSEAPQPEYGFPLQIKNEVSVVPAIVEDRTSKIKVEGGEVKPGDLNVYVGASSIPEALNPRATIAYNGVVYQAEEQPPVLVKGKAVVRKFKLQKLSRLAPRPKQENPGSDRVTRLPGF